MISSSQPEVVIPTSAGLMPEDLQFLSEAAEYLENPSFLAKASEAVGRPLSSAMQKVVPATVARASTKALSSALRAAIWSIPQSELEDASPAEGPRNGLSDRLHQGTAVLTGAVGGLFGAPGLMLELPVTTTIMLRSIAEIARRNGEDLSNPEAQLQCLAVFSHGGPPPGGAEGESAYLTARIALSALIKDASRMLGAKSGVSLLRGPAAALVTRLIAQIAARFNLVVSQKLLAQSVPLVGAGTGAVLNAAFLAHFNRVARYHFGIRRLERQHGRDVVQSAYGDAAARVNSADQPQRGASR